LLELGQPLHAFSADKVKKIVVRYARAGERLETLDEKERILSTEDLVISDGDKPLVIAGIMGGKDSGINAKTNSIILESANFNAPLIRKTSQKFGLRTESSTRYEKALDPLLTEEALFRFINLLIKILPKAQISSGLTDLNQAKVIVKEIDLDLDWLDRKIGQSMAREQIIDNLEKLGFIVKEISERLIKVIVPSWRATKDVSLKEDLAEEILRIHGYDNIESQLPQETLACPESNQERTLERKVKNILALKYSLSEVYNYSFVGEEQLKKLNIDFFKHLRLANPSSDVHTMLRQSLIPNLVNNIKTNQAKYDTLGLFEIGSVFFNAPGDLPKEAVGDGVLPYQEKRLGIVLAGEENNIFLKTKGLVSSLLESLLGYDLETEFLEAMDGPAWADPKEAARIIIAGQEIGLISRLNKTAVNNLNLKKKVVLVEINFKELLGLALELGTNKFKELAKYPALSRDLAFVLDKKILYNDIRMEIVNFDSLIKRAELFDVYSGDKLSADERGLAFHLSFQSAERTLAAEEVEIIIEKLLKHLHDKFEARLRE
jgi:phenylalanyl-tRNA synthetase beta chain